MSVRLGACKTGLSKPPPPQLFYITDRSKAKLLFWFLLLCFDVECLYCLILMYVFIFLVTFGQLSGIAAHSAYDMV